MNNFSRSVELANAPLLRRKPNFRQRLDWRDRRTFCFRGHCSEDDVQQLAAESGDNPSVVIGVGGGALLSTAEALARQSLGLPFVAAPTIAAAWPPGRRSISYWVRTGAAL